jgi:hypothetical protein
VRLVNFSFPPTIQFPTFFTTFITAPYHQLTPPDASKLVDNIFSSPSSTTLRRQSKMSQKRSQKLQRPQQNWRGDADIISMETRILPNNLVPSFLNASRRFRSPFGPPLNRQQRRQRPPCLFSHLGSDGNPLTLPWILLTRSSKKKSRYAKRALTAPA